MSQWRYNIGQRWRCTREAKDNPWVDDDFDFIIIAKGRRSGSVLCRVVPVGIPGRQSFEPYEQEYTHAHLKEHAKFCGYVEVENA